MKEICHVNLNNASTYTKRYLSVGLAEDEDEQSSVSMFIFSHFRGLFGDQDVNEVIGGMTDTLYVQIGGRVTGALKISQPPQPPHEGKLPVFTLPNYTDPVSIRGIPNECKAHSTPLVVEDFDEKLPSISTIFLLYAATLYCEQAGIEVLYVYVPQYIRRVYDPTGVPLHYTIYKIDEKSEIQYAMRGNMIGSQDPVYIAYGLTREMKKFFDYLLRHASFLRTEDWKTFELDENKYTEYARMFKIPAAPKM